MTDVEPTYKIEVMSPNRVLLTVVIDGTEARVLASVLTLLKDIAAKHPIYHRGITPENVLIMSVDPETFSASAFLELLG